MSIKTIIALLLFFFSVGLGMFGAYELNVDRSKDYVETKGKITGTERLSMQKKENKQSISVGDKAINISETNTYYYLKVKYTYTVNDKKYEGSYIDAFQTKNEELLEKYRNTNFPVGKTQKLFYRIDNHQVSVLEINKNLSLEAFIGSGILLIISLILYISY